MAANAQRTPNEMSKKIDDYILKSNDDKEVPLSEVFGAQTRLIVLHNMGETCPTCLIYGSEFNGALKHLEARAAFCAVGPDDPATQKAYVKRNGWQFNLYSGKESAFIKDLGFEDDAGNALPGVSILQKKDETITLTSQVNIAKDDFCPSVLDVIWMLPENGEENEK